MLRNPLRSVRVRDKTDYLTRPSHATFHSIKITGKRPLNFDRSQLSKCAYRILNYFGDSTIIMVRPSNLGCCSITEISAVFSTI